MVSEREVTTTSVRPTPLRSGKLPAACVGLLHVTDVCRFEVIVMSGPTICTGQDKVGFVIRG